MRIELKVSEDVEWLYNAIKYKKPETVTYQSSSKGSDLYADLHKFASLWIRQCHNQIYFSRMNLECTKNQAERLSANFDSAMQVHMTLKCRKQVPNLGLTNGPAVSNLHVGNTSKFGDENMVEIEAWCVIPAASTGR